MRVMIGDLLFYYNGIRQLYKTGYKNPDNKSNYKIVKKIVNNEIKK